jgi:hypothetical protein
LVVLTILSAVLVLPALLLAAFSAFFFDDPNGGALAWVLATPFLTLPITLVASVFISWWLHATSHPAAAVKVAALPSLHLLLALTVFFVATALYG